LQSLPISAKIAQQKNLGGNMNHQTTGRMRSVFLSVLTAASLSVYGEEPKEIEQNWEQLEKIQMMRDDEILLSQMLPIVHCSFYPSKYEEILLSQLRNSESSTKQFRTVSEKIGDLLVNKVIDCLPTKIIEIETPVTKCMGTVLSSKVEFVSIMRSGDAMLETFLKHFPEANVSKFLIQRDEKTAKPQFKYMKISPDLGSGNSVVITEPMIATGGTLEMVISMLKARGVKEENIIVASICAAPEGLILLNDKFPKIKVVITALDQKLNERKFIVPGLGDFGDRYFGTADK
jgi:uracil phosphoribosyltransferase